jgi:hypothetical protein
VGRSMLPKALKSRNGGYFQNTAGEDKLPARVPWKKVKREGRKGKSKGLRGAKLRRFGEANGSRNGCPLRSLFAPLSISPLC